MWASDYLHGDSTWPYSRDIIERNFQGVDAETVQRITHDTVTALITSADEVARASLPASP